MLARLNLKTLVLRSDAKGMMNGNGLTASTRVVLDEALGLELSNFARFFKLRQGVNDDLNDLWFMQLDYQKNAQESMARRYLTSSEEDLKALAYFNA